MSYVLNDKIKNLKPYQTDSDDYDIRLDANESFINIPENILDNISEEILKLDFNRYPDPTAAKCCRLFAEFHGIDDKLVMAGNGSDELIMIIITAFLSKNDKILFLSPDFSMYSFYAYLAENECITLGKNEKLNIDVDEIIDKVRKENISAVIFSNPCNPTGQGVCKEDVIKLIESTNALIILDEAYMDFWDQSLIREADNFDNLIILRTCSKAFAMASIRLGFAVANENIAIALRASKSPYNVNSVTQAIGSTVLKHKGYLKESIKEIIKSREFLYKNLKKLENDNFKVFGSKTNFILVKLQKTDYVYNELKKASILVRNLGDFLRITAGNEKENQILIETLKKILK